MRTLISSIGLLIWWFAVMDASGAIAIYEYRWKADCETLRSVYLRVPTVKVTTCIYKEMVG